ncbi:uncharacterized protein AMSG_00164 [Thecamonas trahens ATCC 50062]|uniref:DIRP domain-containing protein n=1 Tax=Thecamonas trahens ATCC 50062 TaxID=461836 RepID=A0A0L0D1E4_THETB|nr:hypothetical protein AMSG_00164 [Thecamonas trahens ATCC 50062]KNC46046.1 hypothetical protein AMSG_00164 [Thecamonas trahens ATCC 50062]|eukprot:XP_013763026.1 hypothetical protein AMSG_00164 [Thecamonas trahens ATCC 50062]
MSVEETGPVWRRSEVEALYEAVVVEKVSNPRLLATRFPRHTKDNIKAMLTRHAPVLEMDARFSSSAMLLAVVEEVQGMQPSSPPSSKKRASESESDTDDFRPSKRKRSLMAGRRPQAAALASAKIATHSAACFVGDVGIVNMSSQGLTVETEEAQLGRAEQIQAALSVLDTYREDEPCAAMISTMLASLAVSKKLRNWTNYEFLYAAVDEPFFADNPFEAALAELNVHPPSKDEPLRLTRPEWRYLRSLMPRPRRFSAAFVRDQRAALKAARRAARLAPDAISVGASVRALHPASGLAHSGRVLARAKARLWVQFDRVELGTVMVHDTEVAHKVTSATTASEANEANATPLSSVRKARSRSRSESWPATPTGRTVKKRLNMDSEASVALAPVLPAVAAAAAAIREWASDRPASWPKLETALTGLANVVAAVAASSSIRADAVSSELATAVAELDAAAAAVPLEGVAAHAIEQNADISDRGLAAAVSALRLCSLLRLQRPQVAKVLRLCL